MLKWSGLIARKLYAWGEKEAMPTIKKMTLEQAKAQLIEMAVGFHDYENIESWEELAEGAAQEEVAANERARSLAELLTHANEQAELNQLRDTLS